ncbi:MAG: SDR family NAD(P)-dependent oxidoreductase [Streptosporangiaceae bacterium]
MATEEQLVDYLKRVTADLHDTRARLRQAEERSQEPVAIVAMACRFPGGVDSPEALWDLVDSGVDAIGEFPADRGWDLDALYHPDPDHPGTTYTRRGGFLDAADRFDAGFFGISPREVVATSPQQRLLLETAWEAFERAGIDPATLRGSRTGVYAGTATTGATPQSGTSSEASEGYAGNAPSLLSGRVSYTFGLEGPAVTVETACSSALVAMHLACQALRQEECTLAVAGGVTVMATPEVFTGFSRQRGLSPDGRCKAFAADADGTGWGEGVGVVVLERLSDARRNGRRVLAVIRGSAVNQDGASNGFAAPHGPSQQRVIRQALAGAGLAAAEVDAVEAHGTGTALGDPIEADALLAAYGRNRPEDRPLWLGSVKSNIGHTQGAAGVAGVIKMVMAMRHGVLPASLHLAEPTPHVDWDSGAVSLLTEAVAWPETGRPRRAGVSSFGISGTNAHLILEQAPEPVADPGQPAPAGVVPWALSARTGPALRAQARALAERVEARPADTVAEVGWSLATTRSALEYRAAVVGADREELLAGLRALAADGTHPAIVGPERVAGSGGAGPVLVFPGQGSQWVGMGSELLDSSPVFAARMAECEDALAPHVDWSLTGILRGDGSELGRVEVIQPVLWATMVSLAAVWASYGVTPAAVVGHSQGEIAAACVAGALSLADAARVVAVRSQALRRLSGGGAMASLGVGADEAGKLLAGLTSEAVIAAVNGPASTVVSGPPAAVAAVAARCAETGGRARMIDVDYASHGPQVDEIVGELTERLAGVGPVATDTGFYSTVTGGQADTTGLDTGYWVTNLRSPVRFADAIEALLADGHRVFVEVSPHPVLTIGMQETFEAAEVDAVAFGTLRRDHGGREQLARAVAQAFTAGLAPDWPAWFPGTPRVVELPTYAFQRQRYWPETGTGHGGDPSGLGLTSMGHPILGAAVELAEGDVLLLTGRLTATGLLADHQVQGKALVPGAALVEWALRAADEVGCAGVDELVLQAPLLLPPSGGVRVQVVVRAPADDGRREVRVYSRPDLDDLPWTCHAEGVLGVGPQEPGLGLDGAWPPAGAQPVDVSEFYARAAADGYGYGPAFRGLAAAWRHGADILAEVVLPEAAGTPAGFGVHPALLDAALHPALLMAEDGGMRLPFAWSGVSLRAADATRLRVRLTPHDQGVRVVAADAAGAPVLSADAVAMRPVDLGGLPVSDGLYLLDWTPLPGERTEGGDDWAVLGSGLDAVGLTRHRDLDAIETAPPVVLSAVLSAGDALGTVKEALALVQGWLAEPRLADSRLALVTTRAVAVDDPDPAGAGVWGLVRSAQAEHPDRFVLVDLEAGSDDPLEAVRKAIENDEPQVAVRSEQVLVPRLIRATADSEPVALDPDGAVLITGGTGLLGGLVAEHLVRSWDVRNLVLVSRRGPDAPGADELLTRLRELGADVHVVAADVSDATAVADLVAAHRLTGVIHAAGILDDAVVTALSPEQLEKVWAAKATAAAHLHAATAELPLAMFLTFTSAAGVVGNPGQAGYAAASAVVDALTATRRAAGLAGASLAWGLWAEASEMTGHLDHTDVARLRAGGMRPLSAERGLALLDTARRLNGPLLVAADLEVSRLPETGLPSVLRALAGRVRRRTADGGAQGTALITRLAGLDATGRSDAVLEVVSACVAGVLGHRSAAEVRARATFKDLGFDSLTAVELRNRLAARSGLRLPATLVFDHPTPQALADYLLGRLTGGTTAPRQVVATADSAEPIAIVAMACRYPGEVESAEGLWELVADGRDAVGGLPADRGWDLAGLFHPDPDHAGTSYAREGGFVHDADRFDAGFFGISPREALVMDPQQRLLLEVSWELLEVAGIDPLLLRGSRTGVYAGVMYHDYAVGAVVGDARLEAYGLLAGSGSVVSGRVAYSLGLEGPAVTVDTACSSSLVALHLAGQALRAGECDLALAGGVTVMATPDVFRGFSRNRGLAVDGRCKAFAGAADGTGWGEGVGLVLLERLSDARRHGRRVLAVVRGSAVNQDGASNGLTAPNGPSQERVIRQALVNAGLDAVDVDVVEGHGTGTVLGDPIEAQALLATYGQGRVRPLWLGSVKSNIGHTQAAAGVAGVIKMVKAMEHGVLPASLHIDVPSPHVDWESGRVRLLSESVPWSGERPRRAGVSSFGASGTNAHVILEQGPELPVPAEPAEPGGVIPWVVSAPNRPALRAQAEALAARGALPAADVGWSLATTRTVFDHRAVVVGRTRDELLAGLTALAQDEAHPGLTTGVSERPGPGPVLVFPGQGSQWVGMGAELLESAPVFAARIAECEAALSPYVDWSLTEVLRGDGAELGRVDVVQPVLWAVMVSLAAMWASHGVVPAAVVGHSQGEIAAACVAGALSLADAAKIVALRSGALRRLAGGGAMAALGVGPEQACRLLTDQVVIAAVNGPDSVVVSGPPGQVATVVARAEEEDLRARLIDVDYASHGPQIDEITDELTEILADIRPRTGGVAFYSTVTAAKTDQPLDTAYWVTNLRQPVRFADTLRALLEDGHRVFIEASPHPVLTLGMQETFEEARTDAVTVPTLRRDHGDRAQVAVALAQAFTAGAAVDWRTWFPADPAPNVVDLPTYAFQRERYWLAAGTGDVGSVGLQRMTHPHLPAAVSLADGGLLLTGRISARGWPADHQVLGSALMPGTALVEWALRAADEVGCSGVEELTLQTPMVLPATGNLQVQVVIGAAEADGRRDLAVHSRPEHDGGPGPWVCHATGALSAEAAVPSQRLDGTWPPAGAQPVAVDGFYARAASAGYGYGPAFQGLNAVWRDGPDLLAEVTLPEPAGEPDGFGVHPALLDAALHPALLDSGPQEAGGQILLPFSWTGVSLWAGGATAVRVRLTPEGEGLRVLVADAAGAPVLSAESVVMRAADPAQLQATTETDGLFTVDWVPVPASGDGAADEWAVLGACAAAPGLERYPDLAALSAGETVPPVVLAAVTSTGLQAAEHALTLLQGWLAEPRLADATLVVVTRGAVPAGDVRLDLAGTGVWGMVRSAQSENPGRFVLLDLVGDADDAVEAVQRALAADEPQVAVRSGQVLAPRLVPVRAGTALAVPTGPHAWCLDTVGTATLENLRAVPCPEVLGLLGWGEVRLAVHAAGVNFRDVLVGLGMVPGQVGLGGEGAGVVVEVGSGVVGLSVGDRVMGVFGGAFGPWAVADARMLVRVPVGWGMREAAAVPIVFLTAWYGLVVLGGVRAGERVLVHAATGGVGMAAVQIARYLGAEVYATASPGKHGVLAAMGVDGEHRASSRDVGFESVFPRVDVVLNCLSGEFVDASLRLLGPGGRLLEMGKTDVRDPGEVAAAHVGVSYRVFDLVTGAGPELIGRMLATLSELFVGGSLVGLPVRAWPLSRAREALRFLGQARHTGKLVLDVPAPLDRDGTVLITGGTGTLGGIVAEHVVRVWGVRRVVLVSRSGDSAEGVAELVSRLVGLGAEPRVVAADVSDLDVVRGLVAGVEYPLTGVVHAAGVLDDAVITSQTSGGLGRVWGAKATAAMNLHEATADLRLSIFVTFSSTAATLGSPGQGNYAAANAFCDALAWHRTALGLPAVSVGWGLWATASGMTRHLDDADLERMTRSGIAALTNDQALSLLDAAVRHPDPHLVAMNLDIRAFAPPLPALLRTLGGPTRPSAATARPATDWAGRLSTLSAAEQHRVLLDLVRGHAAAVLGHPDPGAVQPDVPFKELGFDSLTAVELRNRLAAGTGLRLPATFVFTYPTPSAIAEEFRARLAPAQADPSAPLFAELERLESAVSRLTPGNDARSRLTKRLESLLWRLGDGAAADGHAVDGDILDSASDDELFELIDREVPS